MRVDVAMNFARSDFLKTNQSQRIPKILETEKTQPLSATYCGRVVDTIGSQCYTVVVVSAAEICGRH